eukprot:TRINITY_DN6426_c0_g1_i1.p1 TRINITY_DN6426_c0_g1~~TRINITY_DN6426_c0_g1_i1.p1  ORF type:complete len:443 (+),score=90.64 TRINITY_DN6426_c0_g1_i1:1271-2599(+)
MDSMEDDDPVVEEIDVFVSTALRDNAFVVQYPLRPVLRPYKSEDITAVRAKIGQKKLEMSVAVNKERQFYNESNDFQIDSVTLASTTVPARCNYAIGQLENGQLHLLPVTGHLQMRPTFSHVDKRDEQAKLDRSRGDDDMETDVPVKEEPESVAVQQRYQKRDIAGRKKPTIAPKDEEWVDLAMVPNASALASLKAKSTATLATAETATEYLQRLLPRPVEPEERHIGHVGQLSSTSLRSLPVQKQVETIVNHAQVVKFDTVCHSATNAINQEEVLRLLPEFALLVNGLWCARQSQVCTDDRQLLFREYAMSLFRKNEVLSRKDFREHFEILPAMAERGVLDEIATLKKGKGWTLKGERDAEFEQLHPDIVLEQDQVWEKLQPRMMELLAPFATKNKTKRRSLTVPAPPIAPADVEMKEAAPAPPPVTAPVAPKSRSSRGTK